MQETTENTENEKLMCGYCDEELGSLMELVEKDSVHFCFKHYSNLFVDMENMKIWGKESRKVPELPISSIGFCSGSTAPGCSKYSGNDTEDTKVQGMEQEAITQLPTLSSVDTYSGSPIPQSSSHSGTDEKAVWSHEAVQLLISLYKENKHKFESPMFNKKQVWEHISDKLKKFSVLKSALKCDEKWRNLKKTYDKIINEKNSTGNSNFSYWPYFEEFHEIYFKDPHFNPICTVSSSGVAKKRTEKTNDLENIPEKKIKKTCLTVTEIEERRQKRHEEKMKQKETMFNWFKENFANK